MTPLHYDDLPKTVNECWELLGLENQPDAILAFIKIGHEKNEKDLLKFKKTILKLSGLTDLPKFFDSWTSERQVNKTLKVVDRDKVQEFKDDFVRYWILLNRRTQICNFLDAASIPNENGYIDDNYNEVTDEMWSRGLSKLWENDELFVKIYLGYILLPTRKVDHKGIWTPLANVLGKNNPKEISTSKEVRTTQVTVEPEVVQDTSPLKVEDSGEFLLYERLLIKSIAQGAISRTSSLDEFDAVEIARQVIDDAPGRPRLFFILGFAQALHSLPPGLNDIKGLNADRRCWFYNGYLHGLARNLGTKEIHKFINDQKSIIDEFSKCTNPIPFIQSFNIVLDVLVEVENYTLFSELIPIVERLKSPKMIESTLSGGNEIARELLSQGRFDAAHKLNAQLISLITKSHKIIPSYSFARFLNRFKIREGIISLGKRDFEGAKSKFGIIASTANGVLKLEMRAWIAMAKAAIPDFYMVFPSGDKSTFERIGEKMLAVVKEISEQDDISVSRPFLVSVCAGVAEYCQERYDKSYIHFNDAADAVMKQGRSVTSSLYLWIRFMRSSSQIMNLDASSVEVLAADFEAIQESKIKPSNWFYLDLVESATVFADPKLLSIILSTIPPEDGEKKFSAFELAGVLAADSQKRLAYTQWLPNSTRQKSQIFKSLCKVIKWDLESKKTESALCAIDTLEILADESEELSADFLEFITTNKLTPDILDDVELYELKFKLLLRLKRNQEANLVLVDRFLKFATSSNDWKRQQAHDFLLELIELGIDLSSVDTVARKVRYDFNADETELDIIKNAGEIKILYVGGNETQRRYEKEILQDLEQKYPKLVVEFIYPGWTYNFTSFVDSIKSKLSSFNGLVLSSLVRTNFGRNVRKICNDDCPWWPCTGSGRDSIKRKIITAATHAAKIKQTGSKA